MSAVRTCGNCSCGSPAVACDGDLLDFDLPGCPKWAAREDGKDKALLDMYSTMGTMAKTIFGEDEYRAVLMDGYEERLRALGLEPRPTDYPTEVE